MIDVDEDALFCDFAETYHIFDFRALPPITAARLASGLRDNSRIKLKMSGNEIPIETSLMMAMVDCLNILIWQNTKDAQKGINRPKSILSQLTDKKENQIVGYRTPEEFMAAWKAATEKG